MAMRRDKAVFRILYGILLAAIILLTDYAVVFVQANIDDYEASQPDHVVNETMEKFIDAVRNERASEVINYPEIKVSPYDSDVYEEYNRKLAMAQNWTWKILSGSYSEVRQVYGFYGDGELLAKFILNCTDSRIIMEILTANTWEAGEISPVLTLTKYTEYIEIPSNFTAVLNDRAVYKNANGVECTEKDGNVIYSIPDMYNLKEVKVYDHAGRECKTVNNNGYVTAEYNTCNLILPSSYKLTDEGYEVAGGPDNGGVHYIYNTAAESLTISDGYGNSIDYKNGDQVSTFDLAFTIPDNFEIKWPGKDLSLFETERVVLNKYDDYRLFAEMPGLVKYEIKGLLKVPELEIRDNLGNPVEPEFIGNRFEITEQTPLKEVPQEILVDADPVGSVEMWSLFLSNDLKGTRHGFGIIKEYLVPDTYLYKNAEAFAKSIDITFASTHETPVFIEEGVSNYVRYSDNLFSCDVYVNKEMNVITNYEKKIVNDKINSTFFFCYYEGKWRIAGLIAKGAE